MACVFSYELSHYFHIIGDKLINPTIGFYIPIIIRIPIKGGMTIPNIATFDHGTYCFYLSGKSESVEFQFDDLYEGRKTSQQLP